MHDLNQSLFLALNASDHPPALLVTAAIVTAKYLILLVPLLLCAMWLWGDAVDRFTALCGLVALLIAIAINQGVGMVAYSPRPFLIGLGHTLIDHRPSSSFPSNHATVCFTVAAVLAIYAYYPLTWIVALLGLAIAWSRIYLGIHFPLDMLGAAATASLSALAATWIMNRWGVGLVELANRPYRKAFGFLIRRSWVRA